MFIGDAGEKIQEFIDENPAAAAHYNRSTNPTTSDIKEQIYSVMDGNKVISAH
jgi:hypothetical protein